MIRKIPYVFNWHITQMCNYHCFFCYAKWENTEEVWLKPEKAAKVLKSIASSRLFEKGITRLNIAGGEPLLNIKKLAFIIDEARKLGFKLSIITNGSYIEKLLPYIKEFSMIGLSVDSTDDETNRRIGRCTYAGKVMPFPDLTDKINLLKSENPHLAVKFNTVANKYNYTEDVIGKFQIFNAQKYKLLRQLPFENKQGITDSQWEQFLQVNYRKKLNIVTEDNEEMTQSYIMIAPDGRFFQNGTGTYIYSSRSLYEASADDLLEEMDFDVKKFISRYQEPNLDKIA